MMPAPAASEATFCPFRVGRRDFLRAMGASAIAADMGLFHFASSLFAAEPTPSGKPVVHVGFVRPNKDKYWMGWPGASYDIKAHQRQYTRILTDAAKKLGIDLHIAAAPLHNAYTINNFLWNAKETGPVGLMTVNMCLHQAGFNSWELIKRIADRRGKLPMVVFSPMGTCFTGDLQPTRSMDGVFVASTQDTEWLASGMRMFNTIWRMSNTRICIVEGDKTKDRKLEGLGVTLHSIPGRRFLDELKKVSLSPEMRAVADYYAKNARKIVEPTKQDILDAVKNYVACRRLMTAENCQGFSMRCLDFVRSRKAPPPCLAFSRLRDEGMLGTCEADWEAAISERLTNLLFDRPGFMQDPAPNTVSNTLMAAHCTCAMQMDGFGKPPAPFILRSHSESNLGAAMQVLWRVGQRITIMKFDGPDSILLGAGRVVGNIDTPPSGGCRTSVEIEVDGVADARDVKGFHQLLIYGDLERPFKAYCQLAGIKVKHI